MRKIPVSTPDDELFSAADVARAAGVPIQRVRGMLRGGRVPSVRDYLARTDAVRLVRMLAGVVQLPGSGRLPLTTLPEAKRRGALPLVASGALHVGFVLALILIGSLGLLNANDSDQPIKDAVPVRLVYLMTPGPGGGGGGGGLKMPGPPARAERKAPLIRKISSPVPPVRKAPPPPAPAVIDPPKPAEPPKIEPSKVEPPKPAPPTQTVQAPVVPVANDAANRPGGLNQPPAATPSAGQGTSGGVGTGNGSGIGEGRGGGIGPGSGGGTGGGPFQPGAGIEPPTLLREVKPLYTDEARKRSIAGDVVLEVVVRRDGTVGNLRVLRGLGAGLDEKAIEAVQQWRFAPARRQGAPVDVVVQVSVQFSLR